jgi:XTP/dITP diphosphohydrolase
VVSPDKFFVGEDAAVRVVLASSNRGKLSEFRELAANLPVEFAQLPNFSELPPFEESAPTFAENAAGKALHFSGFTSELVLADDSGLVVPALGGAPGVYSARYAGADATAEDRMRKLLQAMDAVPIGERKARFVCVIALARRGRVVGVVSDFVEGEIVREPCGTAGFGYDPVFLLPALQRTFGQASAEEKNRYSHRGRAFRKSLDFLAPWKNTLTHL